MPMSISVSIRLTAIQVSNMNPTGTRASPLVARANWGTKVHYRLATSGVSSTFLINETPHSVCDCLTKDYYHRIKKINFNSGEAWLTDKSEACSSPLRRSVYTLFGTTVIQGGSLWRAHLVSMIRWLMS
jgi:hypothetical protein